MIFVPLMLLGIILYFTEWRVWSGVIFFFFISVGFEFIPYQIFDTGVVISKATDFALIQTVVIFFFGYFRYDDFWVKNKLTIAILCFLAFIVVSMLYSRLHLHVAIDDILRSARSYFFVLAYFVFRRFTREEILQLLRILFFITMVGCSLYVIQAFTGFPLLAGSKPGVFGVLNRYFNIPVLFYVLVGYALLWNPYKGFWKYYSLVIFCMAAICSQHRGMMVAIFIATFMGVYIMEGGLKGVFKYLLIGGLVLLPVLDLVLDRFGTDSSTDIEGVFGSAIIDEQPQELSSAGTFGFRLGVLFERWLYVAEKPERIAMGVGFMTEGSERAKQEFNFFIGLVSDETGETVQLDTSDMAWIVFLLRLGFVGTFFFLMLYIVIGCFFYKHRKDRLCLVFLVYIVILFINSVSSGELSNTWMMVPALMIYALKDKELRSETDMQIEE